eukprot:TRINITY_DN4684_c0_g2_i1.p2 TRINITY_DN4684_c0_g2~~TRINITY_DN4684_c0_g2_i1.p2  ORF type:complete len:266 (+),score=74.05 TRINITY_DN4684_c0_g2_i1:49-846(+)
MSFKAVFREANLLKKIFAAVLKVVGEANFECTSEGINLRAMDKARVSLIVLKINGDQLDEYVCEKDMIIGLNIKEAEKALKCAGNNDITTLEAHCDDDNISFIFENTDKGMVSEYTLRTLEMNHQRMNIPDDDEEGSSIAMSSSEFARICRDLKEWGENAVIETSEDQIRFSVDGELGNASITIQATEGADEEDESATHIDNNSDLTQRFSLIYLNYFTKATPLAKTVGLTLSTTIPLRVEYEIAPIGFIRYYLAPKFEEDEDSE